VVVEEPDEEPKIYQQQAYNAKIESRKAAAAAAAAAASVITPPLTPTSSHSPAPSPPNPTHVEHQPPTHGRTRTRRTRYASPAAATRMSSSSTTRSYRRRRRNKMKYRRQQAEQEKGNVQNSFQPPPYPPRYPVTPPPSMHFQQRFFSHETEKNPNRAVPPFQWVQKNSLKTHKNEKKFRFFFLSDFNDLLRHLDDHPLLLQIVFVIHKRHQAKCVQQRLLIIIVIQLKINNNHVFIVQNRNVTHLEIFKLNELEVHSINFNNFHQYKIHRLFIDISFHFVQHLFSQQHRIYLSIKEDKYQQMDNFI